MYKRILVCILCTLASFYSYSQQNKITSDSASWIRIGNDASGNTFFMYAQYVSKGVVDSRPDIIKIWIKKQCLKGTVNGKSYTNYQERQLMLFDCSAMEISVRSVSIYSKEGVLIKSLRFEENAWVAAPPGSTGEAILNGVCGLFK